MTNLWEDVKKSLRDFSTLAVEKAEEFGKIASNKAEELTRTGKYRLEMVQLKRAQAKLFTELGTEVYHQALEGKLSNYARTKKFKAKIEELRRLEEEIQEKEKALETILAAEESPVTTSSTESQEGEDQEE